MIHQCVPMLHAADAVGRHTMALQDELVARGLDSAVFVEFDDPDTVGRTRRFDDYPGMARPDDVLVYQFATASLMADQLALRTERLVVNYHNVTPPECFGSWDDPLANHQLWGRLQLSLLAHRAALGVAVSEANRADLVTSGFRATAVVPPIVDVPAVRPAPRPARTRGARWLTVGRLAPNKAVEAAIAALFVYRLRYDPEAELVVVGRPSVTVYANALRSYAADLGLADAVRFAGRVDDDHLAHAYAEADVLVVTSVHEGFCLPVVEAMARGLPVVAYREGALPEVLGDGGVLVDSLDPIVLADALHALAIEDDRRRDLYVAAGRQLGALGLSKASSRLADLLIAVAEGTRWPEGVRAEGAIPAGAG